MDRRSLLRAAGAAGVAGATAGLAGCAGVASPFGGGTCGPGEDEIGRLARPDATLEGSATGTTVDADDLGSVEGGGAPNPAASVTGEVLSVNRRWVVIDDGTGTARLATVGPLTEADRGDCVRVTGFGVPAKTDGVDVAFVVENASIVG